MNFLDLGGTLHELCWTLMRLCMNFLDLHGTLHALLDFEGTLHELFERHVGFGWCAWFVDGSHGLYMVFTCFLHGVCMHFGGTVHELFGLVRDVA